MRRCPGLVIRYMHSTGASFLLHLRVSAHVRAMLSGPTVTRASSLIFGMLIFLCLMAEAFFGYLLPWGQMFLLGRAGDREPLRCDSSDRPDLAIWIRGDFVVSDATPQPFFRVPRDRCAAGAPRARFAHLLALHEVGSSNPMASRSRT